jgi:hypothetical protein
MKKYLKSAGIGCLGIIGLFVILSIVLALLDIDSSDSDTVLDQPIDSVQLAEQRRIRDSISIAKAEAKESAIKKLKSFKSNTDEFQGITFHRDPRTPYYTNRNFVYPYIGEKEDKYWLRLRFQYAADDWLFIDHAIFLIDGEKFVITGVWERDNDADIWEWLDIPVELVERHILEKIAESKSAKIRYVGSQYHKDRTLTSTEKSVIKKTLEIYDALE